MSSPPSTAPGVVAYLVGQVPGSPDLPATMLGDPPLVCYARPGTYQPACIIAVGTKITQQAQPYQMVGSGGAGWLYERYRLEVLISTFQGGEDPQAVQEAGWTCWQAVAGVVRADPSLGGRVVQAFPASYEMTTEWDPDHKGFVADMTCEIEVEAGL